MASRQPVHPGSIVREDCLRALGITVTQAAEHLGVGRAAVSALVNERAGISIEMAHRLAKAFGSTADHWMRMQLAYDLAKAQQLSRTLSIPRIKR